MGDPLYLGTLEPQECVAAVAGLLFAAGQSAACWPLLLVGGWGWNLQATGAAFLENEARHKGVIHLGDPPERHLPLLYNGARALIFPSHYEGFGLPPLEMLACGGAVIASTAAALVEMVGSKAHLVDPEDA